MTSRVPVFVPHIVVLPKMIRCCIRVLNKERVPLFTFFVCQKKGATFGQPGAITSERFFITPADAPRTENHVLEAEWRHADMTLFIREISDTDSWSDVHEGATSPADKPHLKIATLFSKSPVTGGTISLEKVTVWAHWLIPGAIDEEYRLEADAHEGAINKSWFCIRAGDYATGTYNHAIVSEDPIVRHGAAWQEYLEAVRQPRFVDDYAHCAAWGTPVDMLDADAISAKLVCAYAGVMPRTHPEASNL